MAARPPLRPAAAFAVDVVAVLLFVAIGRRSHDESGSALSGILAIAAPLLIALVVAWLVAWRTAGARSAPLGGRTALVVWSVTVVVGLALRRLLFDRGIATAFVIVTAVVLGLFLIGWRLVAAHLAGRRAVTREASEPARR